MGTAPQVWRNLDLMQLTGAVVAQYESAGVDEKPDEILVDSIGLGAGVVDRLRERGLPARGINVSESPSFGAMYINLRAELWHLAKAWLEKRDCRLPDDARLIDELASLRYSFASNGKVKAESKDDMKKRGLKSPDVADSFILTFASNATTGLYGAKPGSSWSKPLRRNIPRLA